MSRITLDAISDDEIAPFEAGGTVHISKCEGRLTIEKTKHLEIPTPEKGTSPSPEGRVTVEAAGVPSDIELQEMLSEQLPLMDPSTVDALEEQLDLPPNSAQNYMSRLNGIIAAILAQLQRVSEKDKAKTEQLKKEYKANTLTAVGLQRQLGSSGLKYAFLTFAVSFLQLLPNETDKSIANVFGNQICTKLGDMASYGIQGGLTDKNNSAQLLMNDLNNLTNQTQSQSNSKQEMTGVLDRAQRLFQVATQGG